MAISTDILGNKTAVGVVALLLILFAASVFFYNRTLNDLAAGSCTDSAGPSCPHAKIVDTQNIIIFTLVAVIAIMAGWLAYSAYVKPSQLPVEEAAKGETRAAPHRAKKLKGDGLDADETRIVAIINEGGGSVYQSDVIRKTGFSKVKVSRILDRLEQKGLIERKRRGMTNLVVVK